jgi:uncharacterized membrane protein HdeD (DUF308 family)
VRYVAAFGRFWWDFVIGDDWRIAAGVFGVLAAGAVIVANTKLSDTAVCVVVGCGILVIATAAIVAGALAATRDK